MTDESPFSQSGAPETHRLLPSAPEAEAALLSSFLIAPVAVGSLCAERGVETDWMYLPANQCVFSAMMAMWTENRPIDPITLSQDLAAKGQIDLAGGLGRVTALYGAIPTAANAGQYLEIIEQMRTYREIIRTGIEHSTRAYGDHDDAEAALQAYIAEVSAIGCKRVARKTNKELMMEVVTELQDRFENRGDPKDVLRTGFTLLDEALGGGIRGDDYILLTGPTKGGKSILAQNIAENVESEYSRPAMIISLEMGAKSVLYRILASRGNVSLQRMRRGWLNEGDIPKITAAGSRFAESKLMIRDDVRSLGGVVAAARQAKAKFPDLAVIVVDYVQLVQHSASKTANREQIVAEISTALRNLGLELGVGVVVLAQENDNGQARESRRLEQDCTLRIKIERIEGQDNVRNIAIPLARNGPVCAFTLTFQGEMSRFQNYHEEPATPRHRSQP